MTDETTQTAIRDAFNRQEQACLNLGSPFTAQLCRVLGKHLGIETAFGRRVLGWPRDKAVSDALALRCCGALHSLVRRGEDAGLAAAYPPHPALDDEALQRAVMPAISRHDHGLAAFLDNPPQTNEVARSGVLLGGFLTIARDTGLPLAVFEIGASAGLNLLFDCYRYELGGGVVWGAPDAPVVVPCAWSGRTPALDTKLAVVARAGCDIKPVHAADPADRARLLDYIWPDQAVRLARINAALAAVAASGMRVEAANAADWVAARLVPGGTPGRCDVLFHSIMWQYLPAETRDAILAHIGHCGAAATEAAPFAWLRLEDDGGRESGLRLTLWPGGTEREMARAGYHGRSALWL